MNNEEKKEQNIKSLFISLSLLVIFLFILFLGFLPKKNLKDTFLIAAVIYFVASLFWVISRFDGFTILRKVRKTIMRTIKTKEATELYNKKEEIKSSNIGVYATAAMSIALLITSAVINTL